MKAVQIGSYKAEVGAGAETNSFGSAILVKILRRDAKRVGNRKENEER